MMARRAEMEAEAKRKADAIVRSAEERAKQLLGLQLRVQLAVNHRHLDLLLKVGHRPQPLRFVGKILGNPDTV